MIYTYIYICIIYTWCIYIYIWYDICIYDKYLYKSWNHHSKIALTIDHNFFPTFLGFRNPSRSCVPERPWRRVIRWPGGYHMVPLCPWRWVGVIGIQWDLLGMDLTSVSNMAIAGTPWTFNGRWKRAMIERNEKILVSGPSMGLV